MGKHIIRTIVFLVAAGVIALGWYLFAQTSFAQSLVPSRGRPPVFTGNTTGETTGIPPRFSREGGRGERLDRERPSGERPSLDTSQGRAAREFAESGVVPGLHGDWIAPTEFQGVRGIPRERGFDTGSLLRSIGVHLGLIGLVILIVFVLRKLIGLIWNAGAHTTATSH